MNDGIKSQSIPPAAGEIHDSNPRIAFSGTLGPAEKGFFECYAIIMLYDVRNLCRKHQRKHEEESKDS